MRAGWNLDLEELCNRSDRAAQCIVEAVSVTAADIIDTKADWGDADSLAGLTALDEGGVRLTQANAALASQSVDDGTQLTDLDMTDPIECLQVEWTGGTLRDLGIRNAILRLDADAAGTGRLVEQWRLELWRVHAVGPSETDVEIQHLRTASASASGTAPADVTFTFTTDQLGIPVGPPPIRRHYDGGLQSDAGLEGHAITLFVLRAIKGDGEAASNAAWLKNSAASTASGTGWNAEMQSLTSRNIATGRTTHAYRRTGASGIARFEINKGTYSAATVTFTTNDVDLGASPTDDVEVVAQGLTPSDSSITYEIRQPAGTWYECVDGDLVGVDNTPDGKDLSALSKVQAYEMRATLTPSSSGHETPTVVRMGVQELTSTVLPPTLATVDDDLGWALDPVTLKGAIPEATIRIRKDGERDYRDIGSELLAGNLPGNLLFRIWLGHTEDLARWRWMLLDSFVVDDYENAPHEHVITGLSPLARLRTPVPPFDEVANERVAKVFDNQTGKAVWEDLVDDTIGLAGRYRGPGLESTTYSLSKTITEADGKDELDVVAFLHGGSNVSSQGRVKYVQTLPAAAPFDLGRPPVAWIPLEDVEEARIGGGLRNVVDEFFVPWDWHEGEERFRSEHRSFNPTAQTAFGGHGLDTVQTLDEEAGKYIVSQTHAEHIGDRVVATRGNGLRLWSVQTRTLRPYLEPGDWVVVSTDQYVGRDPNTGNEIRGPVWGHGVVVDVDKWGRELLVWVRKIEDLLPSNETVTRTGFAAGTHVLSVTPSFAVDGQLSVAIQVDDAAASVRVAAAAGSDPSLGTIGAATAANVDSDGFVRVTMLGIFDSAEVAHIGILAYPGASGAGTAFSVVRVRALATTGQAGNVDSVDDAPANEVARSVQSGTVDGPDADGLVAVTFPITYNAAPVVTIKEFRAKSFDSGLGTGSDQTLVLEATSVTASGFTLRAVIVGGTPTLVADGDDFTAGSDLDTVSETVECNLASLAAAGAYGDSYTIHYSVTLQVTADPGDTFFRATVVVAFDSNDGGGWVERATQSYQREALSGATETLTISHATKTLTVSGLTTNDDIRIRLKSITELGDGQIDSLNVHGFNVATDGDAAEGVTWQEETVSASEASAIDDASHFVRWEAKSAT